MKTIHQRRKVDRERQKRWRKKKLAEGQKQTLVMLGPEAQEVLKREKERTGEPYVQIINRAIIRLKDESAKKPKRTIKNKKDESETVRDLNQKTDTGSESRSQISKHSANKDIPTLSSRGKWFPRT